MQTSPALSSARAGTLAGGRLEIVEFIAQSVAPHLRGGILFLGLGIQRYIHGTCKALPQNVSWSVSFFYGCFAVHEESAPRHAGL